MTTQPSDISLRGQLFLNHPLKEFTSWRVGGLADAVYIPVDLQDLSAFLSTLPEKETVVWLGLGSNVLIRDGGIRGTVIITQGQFCELERLDDTHVRAEAGLSCAKVARFCAREGLVGVEFLAGVPGTMGGALAMNAGCFDGETWEYVESVETIDRRGTLHVRDKADFEIAYRSVKPKFTGEWFIAARLGLTHGDKEASLEKIRTLLARLAATQPTGIPSGGSTFRNPPGDYAARLIEQCGLKGFKIGGAEVSPKHANFFLNTGDATAADLENLIYHVQAKVREKFGIELIPEVHMMGLSN